MVIFKYVKLLKIGFLKGLGRFFKISYFLHLYSLKVNTQWLFFSVTTSRLVSTSWNYVAGGLHPEIKLQACTRAFLTTNTRVIKVIHPKTTAHYMYSV